jgi:hypothetical protein
VGIPKLGLLLSQNFGRLYFFQIKFVVKMQGQHLIALENIFSMVYNTLITPHLTPTFKGFVVRNQILNLIPRFFFIKIHAHQV